MLFMSLMAVVMSVLGKYLKGLSLICIGLGIDSVCMADSAAETQPILKAGVSANSFPDVSAADLEVTIKLLVEEIGRKAGFEAELTAYSDEQKLQHDFESGKINFVVSSSLIMVRDYDINQFGNGVRFIRAGDNPEQLLIVGSANYQNLSDLRGKRIVLAQNDPLAELYADYMALKTFKKHYQSSFKALPPTKVNQLLMKIFFGEAELTAVYFSFYKTALDMNPQLQSKLKIFAQLDNIPSSGAFFHKDTPAAFQEKIIQATLTLGEEARGRQLMDIFKSDRIYPSDARDLVPAKQLLEASQHLSRAQ